MLLMLLLGALLVGCGGGGGGNSSDGPPSGGSTAGTTSGLTGGSTGGATDGGSSGGVSGGTTGGTAPPLEWHSSASAADIDAGRLLAQASFGATASDLASIEKLGAAAWINAQMALPPSLHRPALKLTGVDTNQCYRFGVWFDLTVNAPDQLRQRVAFALSEIFVVSDKQGLLLHEEQAITHYYDVLVQDAFANFRQLLEDVTLAPAMGYYLAMLHNQKPDPKLNIRADENFAREVMQLFTIGLVQLNADGSPRLDGSGQPIPTYGQADVENMARTLTGFNYADRDFNDGRIGDLESPMRGYDAFHDTDPKTVLGHVIPAGGTAAGDLKQALDTLFQHPNVGPFVGRMLIQRLVTSNPSPAYVQRVATVFADNGAGVRGDMAAVIKAILLDPEARSLSERPVTFGKVREPLIGLVHLWRAFAATSLDHYRYCDLETPFATMPHPESQLGQAPQSAGSVFNFFSPAYRPPGSIGDAGLEAPELQILSEANVNALTNTMYRFGVKDIAGHGGPSTEIRVNYDAEVAMANDPLKLVDRLNLELMNGQMTDAMGTVIANHVQAIPDELATDRVAHAVYLIMTSPQYWTQR